MTKGKLLYALAGLVIGFTAGFFFANQANRKELERLRAEVARTGGAQATANTQTKGGQNTSAPTEKTSLSDEELRNVISKADASQDNIELQRKVGQGLYLYAVQFDKPDLLPEAIRILKRAQAAAPQDYDTTVMLGNAEFDLARTRDPAHFKEARTYYTK
ncbi:MAG: hypothetical protein LC672_02785, partial [Acidobacteria bacterium]|nr:hypothetical protein [Acidobacteriota bacterium]